MNNDMTDEVLCEFTRRTKIIRIPEKELLNILQKHCNESDNKYLTGSIVVGAQYDFGNPSFKIRICNREFPVMGSGALIEEVDIGIDGTGACNETS